jgi:hypothetical protein
MSSEPVHPPRPWWERVVFTLGIILAPAGIILLALLPWAAPTDGRERIIYVLFAISLVKFPLLAGAWWLLTRNAERPDLPGVWDEAEQRRIIMRIQAEGEAAKARGDAAALRHLAREAWTVADRLEGDIRAEAVALASVLGAYGQMTPRR